MKKARQIKFNNLRVEIQRLRGEVHKARRKAEEMEQGAMQIEWLTEKILKAVMRAADVTELTFKLNPEDTDRVVYAADSNGITAKIVTEEEAAEMEAIFELEGSAEDDATSAEEGMSAENNNNL